MRTFIFSNFKKLSVFTVILIFTFIDNSIYATHVMGADISYKEIDTSIGRYRFTVSLYRDCSGINFSNESLNIRGYSGSTTVAMTFIRKEEVTPLCKVPDVATNPVTNCPSGAIGNYKGVERWIYQCDFTIGKNIGWTYVGWGSCCRNMIINTIQNPSGQGVWVQAVINTNFVNNSTVFTTPPVPYVCKQTYNTYTHGAVDSFDPKTIIVNGVSTEYDSLSYQLYTPFTAEASNPSQAVNMGNPSVTFNSPLNAQNFLYTTNGVTVNSKTGAISFTPSVTQDAIIAMAVTEWRAVPNSNGVGYTRQKIGYVCRDIQFTVRDYCPVVTSNGIVQDSLQNAEFVAFDEVNVVSGTQYVKIPYRLTGGSGQATKIKIHKKLSDNFFNNVTYPFYVYGGTVDTLLGYINIDSVKGVGSDIYTIEAYYCNAIGYKFSVYYSLKINILPNFCKSVGDTPISSNLNISQVKIINGIQPLNNITPCNSLIGTQGTAIGIGGRYADFTKSNVPKTKLLKGSTFQLMVKDTACMSGFHRYAKAVFIDWNNNKSFNDIGERYNGVVYQNSTETFSINVPQNANIGKVTMRIVTRMDSPSTNLLPCGSTINQNMNQGETEDYELEIIEDYANCSNFSTIYYNKNNSNFTFSSSAPINVASPYTIRHYWTFSNGQTDSSKNPTIAFPHSKLNWVRLVVCVDSANINLCCDTTVMDSIENCMLSCSITKTSDTLFSNPINGVAPYTYFWSTGANTPFIKYIFGGNYYSYIVDSIGCSTNCQINVQGNTNYCSNYKDFFWTNAGSNYTFYMTNSIPSSFSPTYQWTFSNGLTSTSVQPMISLNPNQTYTVKLKYCLYDTSQAVLCCDSLTKQVQTSGGNSGGGLPCNLKANFTSNDINNGTVYFLDSSSPSTGQMYTYYWTFGDGTSSTQKNPTHTYATNGSKLVCLKVRRWLNANNMYCEDTVCKVITVNSINVCNKLYANFNWTNTGGYYDFYNTSLYNGFTIQSISYHINNTNTTYNTPNPSHVFQSNGIYGITFTIIAVDNITGISCTKTITKQFFVDTSYCGCFKANNSFYKNGMTAYFINNSMCTDTSTTYLYHFGNGDTSTIPNPVYTYTTPGLYRTVMYIQRTIPTGGVCIDSFERIVQIFGNQACKDSNYTQFYNYTCPTYISPVCGCDSVTYLNYCQATKAGVKQYNYGVCPNDTQYVKICGYVYNDLNRNCSYDTSDSPLMNATIKINFNPIQYVYTNYVGYYEIYLPKGNYQLTQIITSNNSNLKQLCPASNASINVSATTGGQTYCNNNFFDTVKNCSDLSVSIFRNWNITPGFTSKKTIVYSNLGATPISNAILHYRYLSALNLSTNTSSTYSVSGNVITWQLGTVPANSTGVKNIYFNTPTSLSIGTTVVDSVWIEPLAGDCDVSNNSATYTDTCVSSWDPNDKTAYPSNEIDTTVEKINYLVRFQNTGTAPAHNVRIEDKIDDNFDKASLIINNTSHKMNHYFDDNGKIYFEFPNIMLPDSGTDYEASQGFVNYSILLKNNLPVGTKLTNKAEIYFDFNEAVITNTTVNTIVLKSSSSIQSVVEGKLISIYPNPTNYKLILETELDKLSNVSYSIYDINGRFILDKNSDKAYQGKYKEEINLEELSSGNYILNVTINGRKNSFKVVKE